MRDHRTLTRDENDYVDERVRRYGSSTGLSYLLWFLFGFFGIHRFYNGAVKSGIAMIAVLVIGFACIWGGMFSFLFSSIDFNEIIAYSKCIDANPNNADEACAEYTDKIENRFEDGEVEPPIVPMMIGGLAFGLIFLWWIVDAFLIPSLVRSKNRNIRKKYVEDVFRQRRNQRNDYDDDNDGYDDYSEEPQRNPTRQRRSRNPRGSNRY